jgi:hypothetical protein
MVSKHQNKKTTRCLASGLRLSLLFIIGMLVAACTVETPIEPVTSTPTTGITEPLRESEPPPTEQPTQTPTTATASILLLAPPGGDPALLAEIQLVLEDLAIQEGYMLKVIPSLTPDQLSDDIHLVVSLPPDPGLERLAASASNTYFLGIAIPNLIESSNLSSISLPANQPDQQGFMAGVIAALVTPDWRVGVISVSDTADGAAARAGFMNGVVYFCGTCRQIYPPFFDDQNQLIQYPLFVELPSGATENEWESAADSLLSRAVETVYIYPGAGGESLMTYLAQAGANLVGGTPPVESLTESWVASVMPDPSLSLYSLIQKALQGQEIPRNSSAIHIKYVNQDYLSPGRQKLADTVLADLLAGYIETGNVEVDHVQQ